MVKVKDPRAEQSNRGSPGGSNVIMRAGEPTDVSGWGQRERDEKEDEGAGEI